MKKLSAISDQLSVFVAVSLLAAVCGCASLETTAYRTIGAVAVTVDGAMNAWGDYVRAGHATASDETVVRAAYDHYQQTMRTLHVAVTAYKLDEASNAGALKTALDTMGAAADELVALVNQRAGARSAPLQE